MFVTWGNIEEREKPLYYKILNNFQMVNSWMLDRWNVDLGLKEINFLYFEACNLLLFCSILVLEQCYLSV